MNEMLDSQLSAMFDDELPGAECELLARRLARDESLQARWRHYAVIGAAMRGEEGLALQINLASRVHGAVATEPALSGAQIASPKERNLIGRRLWQGAAAAAVAAGVAVVSVLWLRTHSELGTNTLVTQTPVAAAQTLVASNEVADGQDSYVVPIATAESRPVMPTAEFANYVVAHSEYSSPLIRRNLLSSLVASESGTEVIPADNVNPDPSENAEAQQTHVQVAP
jgi:negative regulator of sigma E activity